MRRRNFYCNHVREEEQRRLSSSSEGCILGSHCSKGPNRCSAAQWLCTSSVLITNHQFACFLKHTDSNLAYSLIRHSVTGRQGAPWCSIHLMCLITQLYNSGNRGLHAHTRTTNTHIRTRSGHDQHGSFNTKTPFKESDCSLYTPYFPLSPSNINRHPKACHSLDLISVKTTRGQREMST